MSARRGRTAGGVAALVALLAMTTGTHAAKSPEAALIAAIESGKLSKVQRLVERGANVNACVISHVPHKTTGTLMPDGSRVMIFEETALVEAAEDGNAAMVRYLIEAGAKPDLEEECSHTRSTLYRVMDEPDPEIVRILLDAGADPNGGTVVIGRTPLSELLRDAENEFTAARREVAEMLLAAGADVNAANHEGTTPLMFAAQRADDAIAVRLLLEAGADPLAKNKDGLDAKGHVDVEGGRFSWDRKHSGPHRSASLRTAIHGLLDDAVVLAKADRRELELVQHAARMEQVWQNDQVLSPEARRDKYMVALNGHLEAERYDEALPFFEFLKRLDPAAHLALGISHGQALLHTGATDKALDTLYDYLEQSGAEGEFYAETLQLISDAEGDSVSERGAALPAAVRRDKYMVSLTSHLKSERFGQALTYFDLLEKLDTELPPTFTFFYGEAYLRTGMRQPAIEKLVAYVDLVGRDGEHYVRALELLSEAQSE